MVEDCGNKCVTVCSFYMSKNDVNRQLSNYKREHPMQAVKRAVLYDLKKRIHEEIYSLRRRIKKTIKRIKKVDWYHYDTLYRAGSSEKICDLYMVNDHQMKLVFPDGVVIDYRNEYVPKFGLDSLDAYNINEIIKNKEESK